MNNNQYNHDNNKNIDIVSFDRRKRAEEIRMGEEAERERRRREQIKRRKAERMRQAQIAQMKAKFMMGIMAIGAVCIVIGIIVAIVKAASGSDADDTTPKVITVSEEETASVSAFINNPDYIYNVSSNAFLNSADEMLYNLTLSGSASAGIPKVSNLINEYGLLSERYMLFAGDGSGYGELKNLIINAPIFSKGYVWSEQYSMKSGITGAYMYDTNTSYITAVANICLAEGSTSFLNEADTTTEKTKDVSGGMTVGQKLDLAINYLFDGNTLDGGLKFDTISSICHIHTADNNGTSSGAPSNKWFNFRFGYLDAYSNLSFNKAMQSLVKLYTLSGNAEKASQYSAVAKQHAAAFNQTFWNSEKQRYIGCIDKNGNIYDYGFTFINLEAIELGIADAEKAAAITSWLDGTRLIESDTSMSADIYSYKFAPRNTTVAAADSWWNYLDGKLPLSTTGGYNEYYQNGGISLETAYHDILARYTMYDAANLRLRLSALAEGYEEHGFSSSALHASTRISGDAVAGIAPTAILKTVFGLSTDGILLKVAPNLDYLPMTDAEFQSENGFGAYGITGITYSGNSYGFLFDNGRVFITAKESKPVKIQIGSLEPETSYDIVVVSDGIEVSRTTAPSDSKGNVALAAEFGSSSYVKLEKTPVDTKKKK